jgi:hypothetical protein
VLDVIIMIICMCVAQGMRSDQLAARQGQNPMAMQPSPMMMNPVPTNPNPVGMVPPNNPGINPFPVNPAMPAPNPMPVIPPASNPMPNPMPVRPVNPMPQPGINPNPAQPAPKNPAGKDPLAKDDKDEAPANMRVTQANYDKIQLGMNRNDVVNLLGNPTLTGPVNRVGKNTNQSIQWRENSSVIVVVFVNGKVAGKNGFGK